MKLWREERSQREPRELESVSDGVYIQRRNIRLVEHEADETTGTEAYEEYVCEARVITESEYAMLKDIEEINTENAIDAYTEKLLEEGVI